MTDRSFVDTKVLVYARDASEPQKKELAVEWIRTLWIRGPGRLSFTGALRVFRGADAPPFSRRSFGQPKRVLGGKSGQVDFL